MIEIRDTIIYGTSMIRISRDGTAFIKEHIPVTHWKNECMTGGKEILLYEDDPIGIPEAWKDKYDLEKYQMMRGTYGKFKKKDKSLVSSLFQSLLSRL